MQKWGIADRRIGGLQIAELEDCRLQNSDCRIEKLTIQAALVGLRDFTSAICNLTSAISHFRIPILLHSDFFLLTSLIRSGGLRLGRGPVGALQKRPTQTSPEGMAGGAESGGSKCGSDRFKRSARVWENPRWRKG